MKKSLLNFKKLLINFNLGIYVDLFLIIIYYIIIIEFGNLFLSSSSHVNILYFILIFVSFNFILSVYNRPKRYFNLQDFIRITSSILISTTIYYSIFIKDLIISTDFFIFFTFNLFYFIGYRVIFKILNVHLISLDGEPTLIFGSGKNGVYLKRALYGNSRFKILGFIDDSVSFLQIY